ncbi:MAG: tRNA (adenosine(37)-N6)-threonylcarbamoyltransferase complex dimerization subunit type 1 TsaB [Deltaproteobacteria bacterium]|nr:tRNA (adenosine(37)-N6)-threonylcarbamoyltransferase complex dimerization subunit type 1 TsaB [Deltaproteobacteria bacterium]
MKILAIDTSGTTGSVAVTQADALLAELTIGRRETHSKHLMRMIHRTLQMAGVSLSNMDGIAFVKGPGSFTGLRIGISAVKGLAATTGIPIAGISSLSAVASQAADEHRMICAMIDARNQEVYSARYRFSGDALTRLTAQSSLPPEQVVAEIHEPVILVGDGAACYRTRVKDALGDLARFAPDIEGVIRASTVALLSRREFEAGRTDDFRTVVPHYLRKSYAQLRCTKKTGLAKG